MAIRRRKIVWRKMKMAIISSSGESNNEENNEMKKNNQPEKSANEWKYLINKSKSRKKQIWKPEIIRWNQWP